MNATLRALFGTRLNAAITLLMLLFFAITIPPLFRWAFETATWDATSRAGCTAGGACWAFIKARLALFFFGTYPPEERWRGVLSLGILLVVLGGALLVRRRRGAWLAVLAFVVPPVCALLLAGGAFGLRPVETANWGGLMLNITLAFVAVGGSLPIGIALAFGRRSRFPLLRLICTALIEFWRGVPLLSVLFMGLVLLPLVLPQGVTVDNLIRAMVVLTLFTSAYMAETIRGGLQGIAPGQGEAALALGMHPMQVQLLVLLPQAMRLSIPGIINIAVDLFKDTTLVSIVGLFDLMGVVNQSVKDTAWLGLAAEGYVFAATVFFFCCLVISLAGSFLERRYGAGRR
ncbi:MAG TPA: amino acid ABC transporter permease [Acetobacteraceae bacterium]|jgi:general L-amino acid transport system permease protein